MGEEKSYTLKNSLPNKLLQDDGTITDITGKPVTSSVKEYDHEPALPNKFMNPDGTYSTLNQIIGQMVDTTIFIIVSELPEVGKENKIYLLPNEKGGFDEYYYEDGKWDTMGVLEYTPMVAMDNYDTINRTGTTKQLYDTIHALNLPVGTILLGTCKLTDINSEMRQEEIKAEIQNSTIVFSAYSTNIKPYEWRLNTQTGQEEWRPIVYQQFVQDMIDNSVTNKLGGEY